MCNLRHKLTTGERYSFTLRIKKCGIFRGTNGALSFYTEPGPFAADFQLTALLSIWPVINGVSTADVECGGTCI
jgi:hypothetical protein